MEGLEEAKLAVECHPIQVAKQHALSKEPSFIANSPSPSPQAEDGHDKSNPSSEHVMTPHSPNLCKLMSPMEKVMTPEQKVFLDALAPTDAESNRMPKAVGAV